MLLRSLTALLLFASCNSNETVETEKTNSDVQKTDTVKPVINPTSTPVDSPKIYSNARFRDVKIERKAGNAFEISGKAQIFEASFSWVIEDGHNELQTGHSMTDAGAPEWGNFKFTVDAPKANPNSTLHLVLFETSAKDGSRVHELPLLLY